MQPAERSDASGSALASYSMVYSAFGSVQSGSAASASSVVYSAFGERVAGANPTASTRYGYAGAWGYQEHDDFPFLHVGHRYYDPSTGRFMQRDPIGIAGGISVYAYASSSPIAYADPSGLIPIEDNVWEPGESPMGPKGTPEEKEIFKTYFYIHCGLAAGLVGGGIAVGVAEAVEGPAIASLLLRLRLRLGTPKPTPIAPPRPPIVRPNVPRPTNPTPIRPPRWIDPPSGRNPRGWPPYHPPYNPN